MSMATILMSCMGAITDVEYSHFTHGETES